MRSLCHVSVSACAWFEITLRDTAQVQSPGGGIFGQYTESVPIQHHDSGWMIVHLCLRTSEREVNTQLANPGTQLAVAHRMIIQYKI